MSKFESLASAWKQLKHWPSQEELESWRLDYYATTEFVYEDSEDENDGEGEGGDEGSDEGEEK
ncbi:uncharacterized protein J4E92_007584 [Alternaria infectoria]|uniref:uncharacterized protein n=1 Tax=Alternaria infectoria TaxID=45303 RepID=UPI002220A76C|nr:uncharacterized protein J4E92_007584 [Alternaria infectoria]KAI4923610.1 hypothetical protein J4E92_007584 [Alternaria infectoria]